MAVPIEVQEQLNRGKATLMADPTHAFRPYQRKQIYDLLNKWPEGKEVRIRLDILTAERVLDYWRGVWSDNQMIGDLLHRAREVVEGKTPAKSMYVEFQNVWEILERLGSESPHDRRTSQAFFAGQAALEAAYFTYDHDRWEGVQITEDVTDADLDPWSSDTVSWAVAAYADPVWVEGSDGERRKEFWLWWLDQAIPIAWQETYAE